MIDAAIRDIGNRLGGVKIISQDRYLKLIDIEFAIQNTVKPHASIVHIPTGQTVAFATTTKHILLLDSHSHRTTGALVALVSKNHASELLDWYSLYINHRDLEGSVTRVKFLDIGPIAAANLYISQ